MTLHLSDPDHVAGPCCGNCRHLRRRDTSKQLRMPGVGPDVAGHCGLIDPGKREGLTRWCHETDWCDQHRPAEVSRAERGAS